MTVVYKTDNHHSYTSRDLIGICTTLDNAISICRIKATGEGEKLDSNQLFNLNNIRQTQGYAGDGEFFIEPNVKVNHLL